MLSAWAIGPWVHLGGEGLLSFLRSALIIALALYVFVILGFGAYSIFLVAKWLVELLGSAQPDLVGLHAWFRGTRWPGRGSMGGSGARRTEEPHSAPRGQDTQSNNPHPRSYPDHLMPTPGATQRHLGSRHAIK